MPLNYATAKNLRGETLAECCDRLRRDHGLFAESTALLWASYFESRHDLDMSVFYTLVARFIDIGVELDQWRIEAGRPPIKLGKPQSILSETWIPPRVIPK